MPFQLNRKMPKDSISRREYRAKKFGSWERSQALDAPVAKVEASEGIHFAFDAIERTPTTLDTQPWAKIRATDRRKSTEMSCTPVTQETKNPLFFRGFRQIAAVCKRAKWALQDSNL